MTATPTGYISHRLLDLFAVIVAGSTAHWIRFDTMVMGELYLFPLLFFALFLYICMTTTRMYDRALSANRRKLWSTLCKAVLLAAVLASTSLYLTKTSELYSRVWFVLMVLMTLVMILAYRYALARIEDRAVTVKNIIIVGGGAIVNRVRQNSAGPAPRVNVCGVFGDGSSHDTGMNLSSNLKAAVGFIEAQRIKTEQNNAISEVWITQDAYSQLNELEFFKAFSNSAANLVFVPDLPRHASALSRVDYVQDIPTIGSELTYYNRRKHVLKLLEDQILAWPILIACLPIFVLIALAIKMDSRGPVFFKQKRYGVAGEEFQIWKFRTMTFDSKDTQFKQATKDDARVTRVGKLLRRTSIDELPQLLNVVMGSMSLVGPRPHPIELNEEHRNVISGYMLRHKIKPGITGLAQVEGFRGETVRSDDMENRIMLDLQYIRTWDIALDIKILLRTVLVVLRGLNAY